LQTSQVDEDSNDADLTPPKDEPSLVGLHCFESRSHQNIFDLAAKKSKEESKESKIDKGYTIKET
jgi:hypothetical protein